MVNPEITSNINYCVLLWSEAGTQHKTKFYSGVLTEWTLMKRQNTGSVKKNSNQWSLEGNWKKQLLLLVLQWPGSGYCHQSPIRARPGSKSLAYFFSNIHISMSFSWKKVATLTPSLWSWREWENEENSELLVSSSHSLTSAGFSHWPNSTRN